MVDSLKKYLRSKDWRLIVIEFVSLALAVLSALLLEAKFFKLFIKEDSGATALAVVIVFGVTFTAHVVADNLQSKTERDGWYRATIFFLVVSYIGVLISLLGMSNYTMAVSKVEKDSNKANAKIENVDDLPKIVQAKKSLDETISLRKSKIAKLESDIDSLRTKETFTKNSYVTKKQVYEGMIAENMVAIELAQSNFNVIRAKEESRLLESSKSVESAGKSESSIGLFLSNNPAALPVLVLVILFVGRLTFEPQYRPLGVQLTRTQTTTTTHEHKLTLEAIPSDWKKAIEMVAEERRIGNGVGLGAMVAKKFGKSEAWVSTSVKKFLQSGEAN